MTPKTLFVCQNCGAQAQKWLGRCPDCNGAGTPWSRKQFDRSPTRPSRRDTTWEPETATAQLFADDRPDRHGTSEASGFEEFDRVLGGGIVPGSMVLLGGEPGIGKSTLLLPGGA